MNDDSSPQASKSLGHSSVVPPLSDESFEESDSLPEKDEEDQDLIRLALHKSPFFTCLDDEQVERFIKVAKLKTYSAGQSVILEGCVDDFEPEQENSSRLRGEQQAEAGGDEAYTRNFETGNSSTEKEKEAMLTEEGFVLLEKSNIPASTEPLTNTPDEISTSEAGDQVSDDNNSPVDAPAESSNEAAAEKPPISDQKILGENIQEAPSLSAEQSTKDTATNSPFEIFPKDDPDSTHYLEPPPPKSGVPSYIYIIRNGQADVLHSQNNVSPASLGTGTLFGEGGFLFGRQHSASVLAASDAPLECYVVDAATFRNYVLPSDNMTKLYQKHATHMANDKEPYMTMQDFVNSCLDQSSPSQDDNQNGNDTETTIQDPLAGVRIANTFNILRNKTPSTTSSRISLADFCIFHLLMARPDPEVDITFLLMDERKRGVIYKEDIANFLKSSFEDFAFDMESDFVHRHFGNGGDNKRGIRPHQFSQFLVDLRREIGQQVFLQEVRKYGTPEGNLAPFRFVQVLQKSCGWRLPEGVAGRLQSINIYNSQFGGTVPNNKNNEFPPIHNNDRTGLNLATGGERRPGAHYFSYCDFLAFQEVLGQLPGICSLIDRACEIKKGPVSADDFKVANRVLGMGGRLSRRQVDIIFQLFDLDGDGYVSTADTVAVAGAEITQRIDAVAGRQGALTFAPPPKYRHDAAKTGTQPDDFWVLLQNFSLTSIAGAIGVVALAPLDLVKTRLMNERVAPNGQRMYRNSFDCLQIALRSEGYFGLYRGLLPQLIGIGPEKAIKLAVNDLLQQSLGSNDAGPNKSGLQYLQEMLAGGLAGACQLLVTNPIEIVKIRMQLQGETARLLKARGYENPVPQSLRAVAKTLGSSGLITGARACLLRDIPFGAIYFPTYSLCKNSLSTGEGPTRSISAANLLLAGTLAGVPASFLTTPADVIKTRLQVIPRPGELRYAGIRDCFTKVYEREGPAAFFRGSAMRVAKISPQFGISLVAYEQLSQLLGAKGLLPPTTVPVHPRDYFEAFPARAIHNKTDDADRLLKNLGSNSLRPVGPWQEKR